MKTQESRKTASNMHTKESAQNFYQYHQITPPSSLFDILNDTFYFAKNRAGEFVYANRLLNEQFELARPEEVIGKTDYDFFRADLADNIRADDLQVMQKDIAITDKLEVLQDGEGGLYWLVTTKVPLKDGAGNIIGVEGFSRDVKKSQNNMEPYNVFKGCMDYLQKHYSQPITIESWAEVACMSLSTFERKFKKHFGCTPKQYIKKFRLQEACSRLVAGYSIQRVAMDCGFCDQSYFTREFRLAMGVTPKQYQSLQHTER